MADGYHSKEPIVSNCAIILLLDDMRVSYLFVVYNQSLGRVSLDKVVVGVLAPGNFDRSHREKKFVF